MNVIRPLLIGFLFVILLFSLVLSFSTNRKISVINKQPYESGTSSYHTPHNIAVKATDLIQVLFLNNGSASVVTITLELIMCTLAGLLLFGPDFMRVKIYQYHAIPYVLIILICSAIISWYITTSFVNNMANPHGLYNYKYSVNYRSSFWLLVIPVFTFRCLKNFKQVYNDQTLEGS